MISNLREHLHHWSATMLKALGCTTVSRCRPEAVLQPVVAHLTTSTLSRSSSEYLLFRGTAFAAAAAALAGAAAPAGEAERAAGADAAAGRRICENICEA